MNHKLEIKRVSKSFKKHEVMKLTLMSKEIKSLD